MLPKEAVTGIKQVITILGSSSDIFKPQIDRQIEDPKLKLDTDTQVHSSKLIKYRNWILFWIYQFVEFERKKKLEQIIEWNEHWQLNK